MNCPNCGHELPRPPEDKATSYSKDRDVRPDQADPAAWTPARDGTWRSPAGRRFRELPEGVAFARRRRSLPMSWAEQQVAASGGYMSRAEVDAIVDSVMNAPGYGGAS